MKGEILPFGGMKEEGKTRLVCWERQTVGRVGRLSLPCSESFIEGWGGQEMQVKREKINNPNRFLFLVFGSSRPLQANECLDGF